MKQIFAFITLALLMSSCGSGLISVAIDNPTDEYVVVTIDTLTVEVPPYEVAWVDMGKGEHTVNFMNDSTVTYDFQQELYMLNPTLSEYLLYEEVYGSGNMAFTPTSGMPTKTVTFLGMEIEGQYDVVNGLISPVRWEYGPRESTPEMIEMDADESYAFVTKLADANEVIAQMMSGYEEEAVDYN